jgi:hypothetical protein
MHSLVASELLQPLHLVTLQASELRPPSIIGRLGDTQHSDASAPVCPCASNTSAWRSFATISTAECLFRGMVFLRQIGNASLPLAPSEGGRSIPMYSIALKKRRVSLDFLSRGPGTGICRPRRRSAQTVTSRLTHQGDSITVWLLPATVAVSAPIDDAPFARGITSA